MLGSDTDRFALEALPMSRVEEANPTFDQNLQSENARSTTSHAGMVWITGSGFLMGSDRHYREEAPAHWVSVDGFWIDAHAVTNSDFAGFVDATGYVTLAERVPDAAAYPGAKPELLVPASIVFRK